MEFDQEAARRDKIRLMRQDRIDRYDRNVPIWWGNLRDLVMDPVWSGDELLDKYCRKWFGHDEREMREFFWGKAREEAKELNLPIATAKEWGKDRIKEIEASIPERKKVIEGLDEKTRKALRQQRWRAKQKLKEAQK